MKSQSIFKTACVCVVIDKLLNTDMEMHKTNTPKKTIKKNMAGTLNLSRVKTF